MYNGEIRKVEDVRKGDLLLGPDSKPREVLDIHSGHDDLYRVDQASGISYTVNSAHILALKRAKNAGKGKPLKNGGFSTRYPLGDTTTMNVVDFMNTSDKFKTVYRGYNAQNIEFDKKNTLLDPYFIGLWLGDGSSDGASITNMDAEIEEYIYAYAESLGLVVRKRELPNNRAHTYYIVSESRINPVMQSLREYGVLTHFGKIEDGRKRIKVDKRIPFDYLTSCRDDRLKVLAGLVDSDGTYSKDKGVMCITSSKENLAGDIKYLVDSLGFKSSLIKREVGCQGGYTGIAWTISFSGALSKIPCKIERKKVFTDSKRGVGISSLKVTPAGYGEYVGFTVSDDHLYLLEDFTVLHNSSKTQDAGGMAAFLARNYSVRFLCIRQFQNRISDSVFTVVKQKIEEAGWRDEFDIGVSTIRHKVTGSEFLFYGIARNIDDIKGTEGVDICWIEEGEGLTEDQWSIIDPTIRKEGSEVWILWNPQLQSDFVQAKLPKLLGDDCAVQHINYTDNPFLSDTARKKAERLKAVDIDAYNHIYLGQALSNDDAAVIKSTWIEAAIDAHIKLGLDLSGARTVGYDVADSGADSNAATVFDGAICHTLDEWKAPEDELVQSAKRAWSLVGNGRLIYDSIGVGAQVGSTLKEAGIVEGYYKFNAGAAVINPELEYSEKITNKEKFENLKAQAWQDVADRFRNTYNAVTKGMKYEPSEMISISSDIDKLEQLKVELATPRKRYSKRGLDMVETKDELAKRSIASPNLADSFIMGACPHLVNISKTAMIW